jgi:polar amino acid transport system ATP-binding protein
MSFVELRGVYKRFGHTEVLRGVDLDVEQHDVVCLIGASGSGKSTLLRCINALEPISDGVIRIGGHRVSGAGVDVNELRTDVGIVFQSFNLFPHMSVLDNVTLAPRKVLKLPRAEAEIKAMASSASPSCAPWRWGRACCCSTRSPRRSIPSSLPRCSTSSATSRRAG